MIRCHNLHVFATKIYIFCCFSRHHKCSRSDLNGLVKDCFAYEATMPGTDCDVIRLWVSWIHYLVMVNLRQSIVKLSRRSVCLHDGPVKFSLLITESPFSFAFSSQTFPVISPYIGKLKTIRVRLADSTWYNWWKPNGWKLNKVSNVLFNNSLGFFAFSPWGTSFHNSINNLVIGLFSNCI